MDNNYNYTDPNQDKCEYSYEQNTQNASNSQYQYQYQYQQPQQQYYGNDTSPMSLGDWLVTIIVGSIPCVGLILYIVWAFSKTVNINKRNYCRAFLIVSAVIMVLYIILMMVFGFAAYSTSGVSFY